MRRVAAETTPKGGNRLLFSSGDLSITLKCAASTGDMQLVAATTFPAGSALVLGQANSTQFYKEVVVSGSSPTKEEVFFFGNGFTRYFVTFNAHNSGGRSVDAQLMLLPVPNQGCMAQGSAVVG